MYRTAAPITIKQLNYISALVQERDLLASNKVMDEAGAMDEEEFKRYTGNLVSKAATLTRDQASAWIERLLELPRKEERASAGRFQEDYPDVPAGRYAVEREDGALAFYRLDKPTEGRWAGYTFLSVQASDELHPIKGRAAKAAILDKIALDPAGAARRYGQEIGSCAICGRTLTDETSREYGIGPVCRENTGW